MNKKAEAALEALLRVWDHGEAHEATEKKALELWLAKNGPEKAKVILDVSESMARFLAPSYKGKVSAAANKILANGPELTARARSFFERTAKALRSNDQKG